MKKLLIYLGIIFLLFALLYIVNHYSNKAELDENREAAVELYNKDPEDLHSLTVKQLSDPNYQNIILPNELEEKLENKEDVIVYFFSPDCRYCQESTPVLTELIGETGAEIVQFNLLEFPEGRSDYEVPSTPTTIVYENGEEVDRFVGGFKEDVYRVQMKQFLETYVN